VSLETANQLTFRIADDGEPHARRMVQLLKQHPEIEQLYGYDRRTAALVLLLTASQLFFAWASTTPTWVGTWWGTFLLALIVGGPISHWCAMGIHEASHNLAARTEIGNRLVAMIGNIPLVVPAAMSFCRYHLWHHVFLGVRDRDNDLPTDWEVHAVGTSGPRKALWLLAYIFFGTLGRGFLHPPKRWEVINIVLQLAIMGAVWAAFGPWAIGYLFLSLVLGFGIHPVAGHWIHEHYLFHGVQETYSYYGPLNWLTFNVGYHNEHHDFQNVPGWRLPELHAMCLDTYGALRGADSWVGIQWRFVVDPTLGHHSRILRSMETFKAAARDRSAFKKALQGKRPPHLATHGL
jgi:sphingolipid delta-4 desaturase